MTKREHSAPTPDRIFLSPAVFHMLLVLCDGERHGYALKRELAQRTGGRLNPGPGVLYGSINRMLEQGLIEESDQRPEAHLDDERRRYYRITLLGRLAVEAETERLREMLRLAESLLGLPDPA